MSNYTDARFEISKSNDYPSILTLIRIILVLISRAGFILIQSGSIPTENFYDLLMQNIIEFTVSLASYGLLGSLLSFGNYSFEGIIGYGLWTDNMMDIDNIALGFCAVVVGAAIITTFLSSRLHFLGCALLAFTYGGFFQPLLMHWMWHKDGWMNNVKLGNTIVEIDDHGGGLVIHVSSSCVGLIGVTFLGRRLLRLNLIDDYSLGAETPSTILTGYIFVALGLIGLSLPTQHNNISITLINDFLSLSGGSLAAIILEFALCRGTLNYWGILRCIQGCVSALIIISSSVDVSSPILSFGVTFVLTIFLNLASKFIYKSSIEDYCSILTVHLLSGIWSSLLQPFVTFLTFHQTNLQQGLMNFSWHIICTLTVVSFTALFFCCFFLLLSCIGFLRNKIEDNCHRRSNKLSKNFKQRLYDRFFLLNEWDVVLEPGTSGKMAESPSSDAEIIYYLEDNIPARPKKSIFTEKATALELGNNAEIKESRNSGNISSNRIKKTRNIYTMKNVPLTRRNNNACNCGDMGNCDKIYKLDDLIKQGTKALSEEKEVMSCSTIKIKNKPTKKMSHHKVNRAKQFGSRIRHVKKRVTNKSKVPRLVSRCN